MLLWSIKCFELVDEDASESEKIFIPETIRQREKEKKFEKRERKFENLNVLMLN